MLNRKVYIVVVVIIYMKIRCEKCGHEWETKSEMKLVTCPSCQLKTRVIIQVKGGKKL